MKTVLATLVFFAASLSLISAATPDASKSVQALGSTDTQAEPHSADEQSVQQPQPATSAANPEPMPPQLEQLRAALDHHRGELQWVQDLLQQAGETLYWAQTRHHQSVIRQQALEDQLAATAAADAARQAQVSQLAAELAAVKSSLTDKQSQDSETLVRMQTLEAERDQLRRALADREQRLAEMEKALHAAHADLKLARAEKVTASRQMSTTDTRYQTCQSQQAALNRKLTGLRRSETDARQSLLKANAERYRLQTDLATCSANLFQAKASFASMETKSQAPAPKVRGSSPASATEAALSDRADKTGKDSEAHSPNAERISLHDVKFRYDSSELTHESRAVLDQVAAILRKQPHLRHEVAGHTDSQGNPEYNLWLSQRRAEKVRQYLISQGVDGRSLKARGYGGLQPIADNDTWAGLVSNRRVELRAIN